MPSSRPPDGTATATRRGKRFPATSYSGSVGRLRIHGPRGPQLLKGSATRMDIKAYRQATIQAVRFLLSQQNEDGSLNPADQGIAAYYKAPYALAVMGQLERASRLCMYIQESTLDEEGDFVGHFPRSPLHQRYYLVSNAWIVTGAQRLGQFALSLRGIEFLGSLQHPKSGGFFTAGPTATVDGEQDVLSTATCGLALLYCGRVDEAIQAGAYLRHVWDNQPAAGARLFLKTRKGSDIVTEFTEENAAEQMIGVGKRDQWYHAAGMAAGFLTKLAEIAGPEGTLDTAQKYLQLVDGCGADRYSGERSGFFGWAAGLLYQATGNQNYRRIAVAVADGLLGNQLANGSWLKASMGEDLTSDVVDATAEGIICMLQILEGLSAGE